jgi:tetratricopeptide (TPR) repeat protein
MFAGHRDEEARSVLEPADEEFKDLWPDPVAAQLKAHLARCLIGYDDARALELCEPVLDVAEHGNHLRLLAQGLLYKGGAMASLGRLREGIALIETGANIAGEIGDGEVSLEALVVLGFNLGEVDNVRAAQSYRDGLALARRIGHRALMYQMVNNIGYTGFLTGEWDAALAEMDGALADDLEPATRIWILANELIIRASRGDPLDAGMVELDELAAQSSDIGVTIGTRDTKANAAQAGGRLAQAQSHWLEIAAIWPSQAPASFYQAGRPALWNADLEALRADRDGLDATGFHGPVVDARRTTLDAGVAALEGRDRDALAGYLEAIQAWRYLRIVWEEALTGIDMATVLDQSLPEVRGVIDSTRSILDRLGARPYMERLESVLARGPSAPTVGARQAPQAEVSLSG